MGYFLDTERSIILTYFEYFILWILFEVDTSCALMILFILFDADYTYIYKY